MSRLFTRSTKKSTLPVKSSTMRNQPSSSFLSLSQSNNRSIHGNSVLMVATASENKVLDSLPEEIDSTDLTSITAVNTKEDEFSVLDPKLFMSKQELNDQELQEDSDNDDDEFKYTMTISWVG